MNHYNFFTTKELKPMGWLKKQLQIQANGLNGNLDKVWRDVRDSAWIGGDAESWERVPYWLDGFIPLAYLLDDKDLISRAKKYIDAIISFQKPNGWICPCSEEKIPEYDTWAILLISKVLTVYYECSGDEKIPEIIYKTLKNYYALLSDGTIKLFDWGKYRWYEGFISINFIYKRYKEDWIKELAALLKAQGIDYNSVTQLWKRPLNVWKFDTHIVNIAMMLKSECWSSEILGEEFTNMAEGFFEILDKYNGTPVGTFTGDECLSGLSPIQGTELCSVAEIMFSYEHLYAFTGNKKWAEQLELAAFNALPATISDDMWTHQYDQMSNQIECSRFQGKSFFRTNGSDANMFGLEPHFGCCTANFGQAWPKLALFTFLYSKDTVLCALPIPSVLKTDEILIELITNYPFENKFTYKIKSEKTFEFKIRIPSFAKNLTIDGVPNNSKDEIVLDIEKDTDRIINVSFTTEPFVISRPHDLKTVRYGSLVFSVPIKYKTKMYEYTENEVERKFPYCDYDYIGTTPWNYAYSSDKFIPILHTMTDIPFSSLKPPITLRASVKKIEWDFEDGYDTICAKLPKSAIPIDKKEEIELYPYGCAKLRMTEIPMLDKNK